MKLFNSWFCRCFICIFVTGFPVNAQNENKSKQKVIGIQPVVHFEASGKNFEIGQPVSFVSDDDTGNFFVLDIQLKMVHVWNSEGTYLRSFGKEGEGPGEFVLKNLTGELIVFKNSVIIIDEVVARIHFFDKFTFEYQKTLPRPSNLVRLFLDADSDHIYARNFSTRRMLQEVLILDGSFNTEKILYSAVYDEFEWLDKVRFIHRPISNLVKIYPFGGHIYVGEAYSNQFSVFDKAGNKVQSYRLPFPLRPLDQDNRRFYEDQVRSLGLDQVRLEFPENGPFYDLFMVTGQYIIPIRGRIGSSKIEGTVYDRSANPVGAFQQSCGELVTYGGHGGRIYIISMEEGGNYKITGYQIAIDP